MKKSLALRKIVFVLASFLLGVWVPTWSQAALVAAWGDNTYGQTRLPAGVNNVKAIAGGDYHSLALRSDGTVAAWGLNNQGQVDVPSDLANVKAIAARGNHCLALKVDGTVVAWGSSLYGLANVPTNLSRVTAIACGSAHSLSLSANGTVVAWGNNDYNQTNIPTGLSGAVAIAAGAHHSLALQANGTVVAWGMYSSAEASVAATLSNVVAIAAGDNFNLALKADGTVVAWGQNPYGQTNVPAGLSNVTAIAAGVWHALALTTDGTVVAWGDNSFGQSAPPSGLSNAAAIAAGGYHNLALVPEGPVQILQPPQSQDIPYASNVSFSIVAAGSEPLSYEWYFNGSPMVPTARTPITTNATLTITNLQFTDIGTYAVVARNAFGSVFSSTATLTVFSPPFITQELTNLTVRAGVNVTLSAGVSGTPLLLYQWNYNGADIPGATNSWLYRANAQPGDSGAYYAKVANAYGSTQTITAMLTVTDSAPYILDQPYIRLANQSSTANAIVPLGGSVTINASARGSLPLKYQWRFNGVDLPGATNSTLVFANLHYDQTGYYNLEIANPFGTTNSAKVFVNVVQVFVWGESVNFPTSNTPTNVPPGLTNVVAVAAGNYHLLALRNDGRVATWAAFSVPVSLTNVPASVTNVMAIAAAGDNNMALRSNGTVVVWGNNSYGQTEVPTNATNLVAIAAGGLHCLALRTNGTVVGWGNNSYGQATSPAGLSNVVAVAVGGAHSLALKADGSVVAWGYNVNGQTNVPAGLSNVISIDAAGAISLALKADGTAVTWGDPNGRIPATLTNLMTTGVGYQRSVALKSAGNIVSWGNNRTLDTPALSNVIAVASGERGTFSAAVIGDGSPVFTLQPASQSAARSNTVSFHARATGVQPLSYQWQIGNQNLPDATNADLTFPNVQGKDTGSYRVNVSNSLGSVASRVATLTIPYNTNLAAALNTNNWPWVNEATANWFAQVRETHDGDVAAQSGAIANNQQSILQTILTGPGTLTFWWKVSSEEGFDFLHFYRDSTQVPLVSISGETDWERKTFTIPTGAHVLRWVYTKDGSVSAGRDAGWLDEVLFTPDPPVIAQQPSPASAVAAMGGTVTFRVTATGVAPLSYQWLKNGVAVADASQSSLTRTNLTRRDSASYAARVSNAGGSTLSSNATLLVRVPQRLQPPTRLDNGNYLIISGDADGGALMPEDLAAFEFQASTNLLNWEALPGVPALTNGLLMQRDPDSTNFPTRFYRVIEH